MEKCRAFGLVWLGLLLAVSAWQRYRAVANGPRVVVDNSLRDLGVIDPEREQRVVFVISNNGDESVNLIDVKSSCGCAPAALSRRMLDPQEQAELTVSFRPRQTGAISHEISCTTSDPAQPMLHLGITARALPALEAIPPDIYVAITAPGDVSEKIISLSSPRKKPFRVRRIRTTVPWLAAEMTSGERNTHHRLRLRAVAPDLSGMAQGQVVIETDDESQPKLDIPVTMLVTKTRSRVSPTLILLGNRRSGEIADAVIMIDGVESTPKAAQVHSGATVSISDVTWKVEVCNQNRLGTLLTLKLKFSVPIAPGLHSAMLQIVGVDPRGRLEASVQCFVEDTKDRG